MQVQQLDIKRPQFTGGLMGLGDLRPPFLKTVLPKDSQGLYYDEVLDKRRRPSDIKDSHSHGVIRKETKRAKKLTDEELQLALSIVGMIKDNVEPDLSENFREYLHK